jgi:putative membrane protein
MMLFGLLWMAIIIGLPIYLVYWLMARSQTDESAEDSALVVLREQYARGEIDDEEFERRRGHLMENH